MTARGATWVALAALLAGPALVSAQSAWPARLTLEDLERMAADRNPTLAQSAAAVRAAEGRVTQVGTYPNPLIGYEAEDLNTRSPGRFKNFFWFQVPLVTAGKLGLSQELATAERALAGVTAEAQRLRVLTTVRLLYYEALGAERLSALREELQKLVDEAVMISEELYNVGQADRPDVLEVEIEAQRAALELARAASHRQRVWRTLAAAAGNPDLPLAGLAGDLEKDPPSLDPDAVMARVLTESPEVRRAQANVDRARAARERVRAERIPNLFVRSKLGYNAEQSASGKDVGFEAGVEIGVPLPLFDRQQGNLRSAEADLEHAQREVERLGLVLRTQLAAALKSYADARVEVERYRREIVPRAEQSVALYRRSFGRMAAAYPQVLIAQRSLYRVRAEYVQALVDLWRNATALDGLLLEGGLEAPFHSTVQMSPPTGHLTAPTGRPAD
jgi:outer membrane protein, heavy metal efflux system